MSDAEKAKKAEIVTKHVQRIICAVIDNDRKSLGSILSTKVPSIVYIF